MKKLIYILLLINCWSCLSQQEKLEKKQLLDSFEILIEEKKETFKSSFHLNFETDLYLQYVKCIDGSDHLQNLIQYYEIAHQINQKEKLEIPFLVSKEIFLNHFSAIIKIPQSAQQRLLYKLRITNFTDKIALKRKEKYAEQNKYYKSTNEEFRLITRSNKTHYMIGDTLQIACTVYSDIAALQPKIFVEGKELTKNEFSLITTCEEEQPCHKTITFDFQFPDKKDSSLITHYIVYPMP